MKEYIGVKVIRAEPEDRENKPGYKVVYADDYTSWSPKAVFEEAYVSTTDMSFAFACHAMERSLKVYRTEWMDGRYLQLSKEEKFPHETFFELVHPRPAGDIRSHWSPHQNALLAKDWRIRNK